MSSAGAAWGVATACAQGWLDECKCASPKNTQYYTQQRDFFGTDTSNFLIASQKAEPILDWEWSGCSYGVQYGVVTSRKLLTRTSASLTDQTDRGILTKLEKHNLKVGRLVNFFVITA